MERLEGRLESSVAARRNELGELVFAGHAPGPVVHRTPEELGIPRVVPDVRPRREVRPIWESAERGEALALTAARKREREARRYVPRPPKQAKGMAEAAGKKERGSVNQLDEFVKLSVIPGAVRDAAAAATGAVESQRALESHRELPRKSNLPAVPMPRHGMPAVRVVEREEVPEPVRKSSGIAPALYTQIAGLGSGALRGAALQVDFENEGHAAYVLTKLRKIAKTEGVELCSSKSADGKTRWFWLE